MSVRLNLKRVIASLVARRAPSWAGDLLRVRHVRSGYERLRFESLEERCLLATLTVTTIQDNFAQDGFLSFREALAIANDSTGATVYEGVSGTDFEDVIQFAPSLVAAGNAIIYVNPALRETGLDGNEYGPTSFVNIEEVSIVGPAGENGILILHPSFSDFSTVSRLFLNRGRLSISNLTLGGGVAKGGDGTDGGGGAAGIGGAILNIGNGNFATLDIYNSTFAYNQAIGGNGADAGFGFTGGGGGGLGAPGGDEYLDGSQTRGGNGGGPNGGIGASDLLVGSGGGVGGGGGGAPNGGVAYDGGDYGGGGYGGAGGDGGFGGGGGGGFYSYGGGSVPLSAIPGRGGFGGGDGAIGSHFLFAPNGGGGGGAGMGGAIFNQAGIVTIHNSTFSGNYATGGVSPGEGADGAGMGGAIFSRGGLVTITQSTFTNNTALFGGSITTYKTNANPVVSDRLNVTNSILDDAGTWPVYSIDVPIFGSNNIYKNPFPGLPTGFGTWTDPFLQPLTDNGGPTQTHYIPFGSPAINAGTILPNPSFLPVVDQRGAPRTSLPDIGAIENDDFTVVELQNGRLSVAGQSIADNLTIDYANGNYIIWDSANLFSTSIEGATGDQTNAVTIPATDVVSIYVATGAGNDTLTINRVQPELGQSLATTAFSVYGGTGNDTLNVNTNIAIAGSSLVFDLKEQDGETDQINFAPGVGITARDVVVFLFGNPITSFAPVTLESGGSIVLGSNATVSSEGGYTSLTAGKDIKLNPGSRVTTTDGNLTLSANQGSSASSGDFVGVLVDGATISSSGNGEVNLLGRGGSATRGRQHGVHVTTGSLVQGGATKPLNIAGTGGQSVGDANIGVFVTGGSITSVGSPVNVTGNGTGPRAASAGVWVESASISSGGTGSVSINGVASNVAANGTLNNGVRVATGGMISTDGGQVSIDAVGNTNSSALFIESANAIRTGTDAPVVITADSVTLSTTNPAIDAGTGSVTIRPRTSGIPIDLGGSDVLGSGGKLGLTDAELDLVSAGTLVVGRDDIATGTVTVSMPVQPNLANAFEVVTARDIVVSANIVGGAAGLTLRANRQAQSTVADFDGVTVQNGATVSSTGSVTVLGTGGAGDGDSNFGVWLTGAGSSVTSIGNAHVVVNGFGGAGAGQGNSGVVVRSGASISSGGGSVSVDGTGGGNGTSSSSYSTGVEVAFGGARITSGGSGSVMVNGKGGNNPSVSNIGVWVMPDASLMSAGSGKVEVTGTGGIGSNFASEGVLISSNGLITSGGGEVFVTGIGNTTGHGVAFEGGGAIESTNNGSITITSDSLRIDASPATRINAGSGSVTIQPRTTGTKIDLGGLDILTGSPLSLGLTDAELDRVTAGTLKIGRNNMVARVTVSAPISRDTAGALQVITARDIVVNANLTGNDGGLSLSANQQAGSLVGNFQGITVQQGAVVSTINNGPVTVNGRGGSGSGGNNHGVLVIGSGSKITSGGSGSVTVNGTGDGLFGSESDNWGVSVQSMGSITSTGSGSVTVNGTGGRAGGSNHGVTLQEGVIEVGSGLLTISGIAGANSGYGVRLSDTTGAQILSSGGGIVITAVGSGGQHDLLAGSNSIIGGASATGPITMNADSVDFQGTQMSVQTTGTVTIQPRNEGTLINLGGSDVLAGSPRTLGLTDAELNRVNASRLNIGSLQSGSITFSSDIDLTGNANALRLIANGEVTGTAGGIIVPNFYVYCSGSLLLFDNDIDVDNVAMLSVNGSVNFQGDADGFDVTSLNDQPVTFFGASGRDGIILATGGQLRILPNEFNRGVHSEPGGSIILAGDAGVFISENVSTGGTGSITVTGNNPQGANQIVIDSGAFVSVADGSLHLDADRGVGVSGDFSGVTISDATVRSTGGGNLSIQGRGGDFAASGAHHGIAVYGNGLIEASGSGEITLAGRSGQGTILNTGVNLEGGGRVAAGIGGITITGYSQPTLTGPYNIGVRLIAGGQIETVGTGNITVNGTGGGGTGENWGIGLEQATSFIRSAEGAISLTGQSSYGSNNFDIKIDTASVNSTGSGAISIQADSFDLLGAANVQTVGLVTMQPASVGTHIDLGGTDVLNGSTRTLGLTNAEVDRITAGQINFGSVPGGAVTVSAAITRPATTALNVIAGDNQNIVFTAMGSLDSAGGNITLTTSGTGAITSGDAPHDVDSGTGMISLQSGTSGIGATNNPLVVAGELVSAITADNSNQFLASDGTIAIANLNAGSGSVHLAGGTFTLEGDNRIHDATKLAITNNASFDIAGFTEKIDTLSLVAGNAFGTTGVLHSTQTIQTQSGTISAILAGNNGLTQTTNGTTVLSGANVYTGLTTISGGVLSVDAIADAGSSNLATASSLRFLNGATLRYTGAGVNSTTRGFNLGSGSGVIDVAHSSGSLNLSGTVSGNFTTTLSKSGAGTLILSGESDNSSLILNASDGTVQLAKTSSATVHAVAGISDIAATAVVETGGTGSDQIFDGGFQIPFGLIHMSGGRLDLKGGNEGIDRLTGTGLAYTSDPVSRTLNVGLANGTSEFNGTIRSGLGTVTLVKSGLGTFTLGGDTDNAGLRAIANAGILVLAKDSSSSVHAIGGLGLTINNGAVVKLAGTGGDQYYDGPAGIVNGLNINAGGTLDLAGQSETVTSLTGSGTIVNNGVTSSTLTIGSSNQSSTFNGTIQDGSSAVALAKLGPGTLTLTGIHGYTGVTTVTSGTLIVNGSISDGAAVTDLVVTNGAHLGGNGVIDGAVSILSGGSISPGNSAGKLDTGSVALSTGSSVAIEINGTAAGSEYDQLNVNGTIDLASSSLNLALGYTPLVGSTFTIINNDGIDTVAGTFLGLAEGAYFEVTTGLFSSRFRITYQGGDGNDVVLQAVSSTPAKVSSVVFGDGTNQRSLVKSITVDYDSVVVADSGAFVLERRVGTGTAAIWAAIPANELTIGHSEIGTTSQSRLLLTFSGTSVSGGSLSDGNYRLQILSDHVHANGLDLDGNGDGSAGGNYVRGEESTDGFFRLFGDTSGNRVVNAIEFGAARATLNRSAGQAGYNALFDLNSNGNVNAIEFGQVRSRLNKLLGF